MSAGGRSEWWLLPNQVTLTRFYASALIPLTFLMEDRASAEAIALALFVYASITDFVDGWLARRLKQTSALGAQLDTLADKVLVVGALVALCLTYFADAWWFWAGTALIAAREIGLALLRSRMAGSPALKTTWAAKWKTTAQMASASALLAVGVIERGLGAEPAAWVLWIGLAVFAVAVGLTLYTGYDYARAAFSSSRAKGLRAGKSGSTMP